MIGQDGDVIMKTRIQRKWFNSDKVFDVVNILIMVVLMFIMLYPLYFVVIASFSEPIHVATGKVLLWPKGFSIESYKEAFGEKSIWNGYKNSLIYVLLGTLFNLALTMPAAYVLSKKRIPFRGAMSTYFVITMFFGGGLLPYYLLVRDIGLVNKPYTLILLGGLSVYNMIIARTYYSTAIPESLYEAAEIDGCSEFRKFLTIALPLSKSILAVTALRYAVGRWNDFFTALIFINKEKYYPLQTVLRNLLMEGVIRLQQTDTSELSMEELQYYISRTYLMESMKYSVILIGALPMLIAYPFVQKHFVKGMMMGSLKG